MAHDPELALRALEQSALIAPDTPKRARAARPDHAATLAAVPDWQALSDHVATLEQARYAPAVPLLARLWHECGVEPVRMRAGHALRAIGTPEACSALVDLIDEADFVSVFLGVRAVFEMDPVAAFDRLEPYFRAEHLERSFGRAIPRQVLATFVPGFYAHSGLRFTEPRAPAWFRDDPRWMNLCLAVRRHPALGDVARSALRHGDPSLVDAALRRALEREGPRVVTRQTAARGDLLARYERGDYETVWNELRSLGAIDGALRDEALSVARATMRRVSTNVEILAARLSARGWT